MKQYDILLGFGGGGYEPKTYFAKLLPTQGEIKEGDAFLYKGLSFVDDGHIQPIEGKQKAKLFLCSRDIQVGDEVYHITKSTFYIFGIVQKVSENEIKVRLGITGYSLEKPNEIFKKIGEISPEAIWVKEGDKFEEDEILKYNINLVFIRCSNCKQFH